MAKYEVTYKCGHTGEVQLYGRYVERYDKLKHLSQKECPECERRTLLRVAQENGYPELTGTDRQVVWAISIRDSIFKMLEDWIADRMALVNDSNREKAMANLAKIRAAMGKLKQETKATFWINNRYRAYDNNAYILQSYIE